MVNVKQQFAATEVGSKHIESRKKTKNSFKHESTNKKQPSSAMSELHSAVETMTDIDVTSFPKIEWETEEEGKPAHRVDESQAAPRINRQDPTCISSVFGGKRGPAKTHARMVRSKSIKSSLCFLAECSINPRHQSLAHYKHEHMISESSLDDKDDGEEAKQMTTALSNDGSKEEHDCDIDTLSVLYEDK